MVLQWIRENKNVENSEQETDIWSKIRPLFDDITTLSGDDPNYNEPILATDRDRTSDILRYFWISVLTVAMTITVQLWKVFNLLKMSQDSNECFINTQSGQHWCSVTSINIGNGGYGVIKKSPTQWSMWSNFGDCSATCGDGIATRNRECINGLPGDQGCHIGEAVEQKPCSIAECSFWSGWIDNLSYHISWLQYAAFPCFVFVAMYLLIIFKDLSQKLQQVTDENRYIKKHKQPKSIHDHGENTSW